MRRGRSKVAIPGKAPWRVTLPKSLRGALEAMLIILESCLHHDTRKHFYFLYQSLVKHFLSGKRKGDSKFPGTSGKADLAA